MAIRHLSAAVLLAALAHAALPVCADAQFLNRVRERAKEVVAEQTASITNQIPALFQVPVSRCALPGAASSHAAMAAALIGSDQYQDFDLTLDGIARWASATCGVNRLTLQDPGMLKRMQQAQTDPQALEALVREDDDYVQAISRNGISLADFARTGGALSQAMLVATALESGILKATPPGVNPANVQFVRSQAIEIQELLSTSVEDPIEILAIPVDPMSIPASHAVQVLTRDLNEPHRSRARTSLLRVLSDYYAAAGIPIPKWLVETGDAITTTGMH